MFLIIDRTSDSIDNGEVVQTPVDTIDKTTSIVIEQNTTMYINSIERQVLLKNSVFRENKNSGKNIYTAGELVEIYGVESISNIENSLVKLSGNGDILEACIYISNTYIHFIDDEINYTLHNESCMEEVN